MMKQHEQRVLNEHHDLATKVSKLSDFFKTTMFNKLQPADQAFLETQHYHMVSYLKALQSRISRF